jgi:hypothetical protein
LPSRLDENGFSGPHYLIDAAEERDALQILELLAAHRWKVNQQSGFHGSTLLGECVSAIRPHIAVIKWLIAHGADLGVPTAAGGERVIDALSTRSALEKAQI